MKMRFFLISLLVLMWSCSGNVMQTTVFTDGFQVLEPGTSPYSGSANPAIYFNPNRGKIGDWSVATSLRQSGFSEAWEVKSAGGENFLAQTFTNLNSSNTPLSLISHPLIVAGDSMWSDCTIDVEFTPMAKFDKCGVVFKYRNPADFFFFGIEGNTVTLKHIQQAVTPLRPIERILDIRPLVYTPGERIHATVTLRRNKVSTILNDSIRMYAEDLPIHSGKIGLISDLPAKFHKVEVKLLKGEQRKLARKKRQLNRRIDLNLSGHPKMVRWKNFDIGDFASNQNVRLGDLTGDGNKEIAFIQAGRSPLSIGSIAVLDLDGELLWQYGKSRSMVPGSGEELPVQIHDLDGDGAREVIFISQGRIYVLDGRNGELIQRKKLPRAMSVRTLMFADLQGIGRDNCMLLSDRRNKLLALSDQFEVLWTQHTQSSSQPLLYDMNGDGRHEVIMGYSVFDPEGTLLYDVGEYIGDRCNGVLAYQMEDGGREIPCLVYAAGDWGLLFFDFAGKLIRQNIMGHVGYISVADYDLEIPGLEVAASNMWGSDGLVHIMETSGSVIHKYLPVAGINRCQPVNWKGDGEEFLLMSADSVAGGLVDKWGQLAVSFPSDGHPVSYYLVQDLTGDARDELLVWGQEQLWIYTQDDNPRMGNTYSPSRNPLYNYSLYHMNHSYPGW
ncbi:MAG: VCBS repeat-containing protein [Bacteroidota bacterium]